MCLWIAVSTRRLKKARSGCEILFHQTFRGWFVPLKDPEIVFSRDINQWPKRNPAEKMHPICRKSNPHKQCCDLTFVETLWLSLIIIVHLHLHSKSAICSVELLYDSCYLIEFLKEKIWIDSWIDLGLKHFAFCWFFPLCIEVVCVKKGDH